MSFVGVKKICGSVGIGRRARLRILWWIHRVGSSPIFRIYMPLFYLQIWRNWHTRMIQVHIHEFGCGFKSHYLHKRTEDKFFGSFFDDTRVSKHHERGACTPVSACFRNLNKNEKAAALHPGPHENCS